VRRGELGVRLDPKFILYGGYQILLGIKTAMLGSLTLCEPDYGSGARAISMKSSDEVKYIRITDFDEDGIPPDHEFMTAEAVEKKYTLQDEDVLFARSGATAGKTFIYTHDVGPAIFAGYCIRFRFDSSQVLPWFVYFYTKTSRYKAWVRAIQRPAGQPNINREELKSFSIPMPELDDQSQLVTEMQAARTSRQEKLAAADVLLAGLDGFLLEKLGLTLPQEQEQRIFAVRRKDMLGKRIDPPAFLPYFAKGEQPKTPTYSLGDIADINKNKTEPPDTTDKLVPYVGLPECDLTEVREVVLRPYSKVKGRNIVREGDILFARIEPSVFNKKYVYAGDLKGYRIAYTSTEFYVVRAKPEVLNQIYLYAMFSCSFVFAQVKGKTTGSSGRRRISSDMFAQLQIPVPGKELQREIATEVTHRRNEARRLRAEAEREWKAAKSRFEAQLLGEGR